MADTPTSLQLDSKPADPNAPAASETTEKRTDANDNRPAVQKPIEPLTATSASDDAASRDSSNPDVAELQRQVRALQRQLAASPVLQSEKPQPYWHMVGGRWEKVDRDENGNLPSDMPEGTHMVR